MTIYTESISTLPLDGMLVRRRVTPNSKLVAPIYTAGGIVNTGKQSLWKLRWKALYIHGKALFSSNTKSLRGLALAFSFFVIVVFLVITAGVDLSVNACPIVHLKLNYRNELCAKDSYICVHLASVQTKQVCRKKNVRKQLGEQWGN